MLTKLIGVTEKAVCVASQDEDVRIVVPSAVAGLPSAPLARAEIHDALVKAKHKAEDFLAAVEGDLEATEG